MSFNNDAVVPVYDKRRELRGHVTIGTTSIGAAKVAHTQTAVRTRINGQLVWLGKDYR